MLTVLPTLDPRRSGGVLRYHTWPHIRTQSVAEHSWNVARIAVALEPTLSRAAILYALNHDIGEVGVGDLPFPVKKVNPDLKEVVDRIEHEFAHAIAERWGIPEPELTTDESVVLKTADLLEMWEWGLGEVAMGNSYANVVVVRTATAADELFTTHFGGDALRLGRYIAYRETRYEYERGASCG